MASTGRLGENNSRLGSIIPGALDEVVPPSDTPSGFDFALGSDTVASLVATLPERDDSGVGTDTGYVTKLESLPTSVEDLGTPEALQIVARFRYDGIDITSLVMFDTVELVSLANGRPGPIRMRVRDLGHELNFVVGRRITCDIAGLRQWTGFVSAVRRGYFFNSSGDSPAENERYWEISGVDLNVLFEKRVLHGRGILPEIRMQLTAFPADTDDSVVLLHYMANHLDIELDGLGTDLIETVGTPSQDAEISGASGWRWIDLMKFITHNTGALFYIDPDGQVVLTDVDTPNAPYVLSDSPGAATLNEFFASFTGSTFEGWGDLNGSATVGDGYLEVPGGEFAELIYQEGLMPLPTTLAFDFWVPPDPLASSGNYYAYELDADGRFIYIDNDGGNPLHWTLWSNQDSPTTDVEFPFTVEASTWYRVKAYVEGGAGGVFRAKIWKTSDPEPDWEYEDTYHFDNSIYGEHYLYIDSSGFPDPEPLRMKNVSISNAIETYEGEIGVRDMEIDFGGEALRNDVLIWGIGQGSANPVFSRTEDLTSIGRHNRWQVAHVSPVWRQATVDKIADSYVYGSPQNKRGGKDDAVAVKITTFVHGFRVGMKARVVSRVHGFDDVLPIRSSRITFPTPFDVNYELVLSHEIDPPWSTYEFWFPGFNFPDFNFDFDPPGLIIPEFPVPQLPPIDACFGSWSPTPAPTSDYVIGTATGSGAIIGAHRARDGDTTFHNYIEHSTNHQRWEVVNADSCAVENVNSGSVWYEEEHHWDDTYHVFFGSATIDVAGDLKGWRRRAFAHFRFVPDNPSKDYGFRARFEIEVDEAYIINRPRTGWSGGINNSDESWPNDTIPIRIGLMDQQGRSTCFDVDDPGYSYVINVPLTHTPGSPSSGSIEVPFSFGPVPEHFYLTARLDSTDDVFETNAGRVRVRVTYVDPFEFFELRYPGLVLGDDNPCFIAEPGQYINGPQHGPYEHDLDEIDTPDGEDPTSTWFITDHFFLANTERIFLNGLALRRGIDYAAYPDTRWVEIFSSVTIVDGDVVTATYEIFLPVEVF